MPFAGFWDRWRRRQLQQQRHRSAPSLRETEKQREADEQINLLLRGRIEDLEVQRQNGPRGTIAHEDSDGRMEG